MLRLVLLFLGFVLPAEAAARLYVMDTPALLVGPDVGEVQCILTTIRSAPLSATVSIRPIDAEEGAAWPPAGSTVTCRAPAPGATAADDSSCTCNAMAFPTECTLRLRLPAPLPTTPRMYCHFDMSKPPLRYFRAVMTLFDRETGVLRATMPARPEDGEK